MMHSLEAFEISPHIQEKPQFHFEEDTREQMIYWLEQMYPFFEQVNFATSEDPEYEGGSFYLPENVENSMAVILMGGNIEDYAKLKQTRPDAMAAMAESLGTTVDRLDGATIEAFILFHEAGHMYDYFINYGSEYEDLSYPELTAIWAEMSDAQLMSLPIPGLSPSDLRFEMQKRGGFSEWRRTDLEFDALCRALNAQTAENLVRVQEKVYRALPKEAFADAFAAKEMKEFFRKAANAS